MPKNLKKYLKTTSKLPQNYWNRFNPPPLLKNVQKKDQKKMPKNFWIRAGPPLPFGKCPKGNSFFFRITSLTELWLYLVSFVPVKKKIWPGLRDELAKMQVWKKIQNSWERGVQNKKRNSWPISGTVNFWGGIFTHPGPPAPWVLKLKCLWRRCNDFFF